MQKFQSDGVDIAFLDQGAGEPIVLVHGFASNAQINWVGPGWVDLLADAGRRVIAIDNRGHGASEKLRDPALYNSKTMMAEDVRRLLDHLGVERADVMGYSMGAWISAHLAIGHPDRVRSVTFGGLGSAMVEGIGGQEAIAQALEADSDDAVTSPRGKAYRLFARHTKSDRHALAACMRGGRQLVERADLARLATPALVAVGSRDDVAGSAEDLAALMPNAAVLTIPDRDHMLAVGDKVYKRGVLAFLAARP